MRELIKSFKALSDPIRIRILKLLEKKRMCVCELTEVLKIGQSNVSHHLKVLKEAGLVNDIKNGLWVDYVLSKGEYNKYAPIVLNMISKVLNDNSKISEDIKVAEKVKREEICNICRK